MSLLQIDKLVAGYGAVDILNGIDLAVEPGKISVIVGPNGAGKSTALKAIFGLAQIREGRVLFQGDDITRQPADRLVARGIAYVPQERNVFRSLSVRENLEMGAFLKPGDIARRIEAVMGLFPPLREKLKQAAGELSGGQRQMVAMGRALMLEPKLLMLDEPTAGLSPLYMDQIFDRVIAINQSGVGVLLVEQNAKQALAIGHVGYVLATGRNRFTDSAANLLVNREVAESFLGG
ncbi:ABC transporter ATP-binding protein [Dongia deserti]|uniref:ABC transporter ATP-binding protein n=1 Tax=Dongia deserti TaxID=2268030 RepID=UPI000E64F050|nr:ABC transporter ATP-binding protein [Dongia deserti]